MAKKAIEIEKRQVQKQARRKKRQANRAKRSMSHAARLYRVGLRHIGKQASAMLLENQMTLAMMITGLLRSRSGQFRKMANGVQYNGKKESLIDRFRRFVRNRNVKVEVEYPPFGQRVLQAFGQGPIVLMIDSTKLGGHCLCLMVSVYYKSRALPLAWVTYKGQMQRQLFKRVKTLLPAEVPVVLTGFNRTTRGATSAALTKPTVFSTRSSVSACRNYLSTIGKKPSSPRSALLRKTTSARSISWRCGIIPVKNIGFSSLIVKVPPKLKGSIPCASPSKPCSLI